MKTTMIYFRAIKLLAIILMIGVLFGGCIPENTSEVLKPDDPITAQIEIYNNTETPNMEAFILNELRPLFNFGETWIGVLIKAENAYKVAHLVIDQEKKDIEYNVQIDPDQTVYLVSMYNGEHNLMIEDIAYIRAYIESDAATRASRKKTDATGAQFRGVYELLSIDGEDMESTISVIEGFEGGVTMTRWKINFVGEQAAE